jgi:hypothetical protein
LRACTHHVCPPFDRLTVGVAEHVLPEHDDEAGNQVATTAVPAPLLTHT